MLVDDYCFNRKFSTVKLGLVRNLPKTAAFWLLAAFLLIVFATGGSSRNDAQSLLFLRPAAVLLCGVGLWMLSKKHVKDNAFMFFMAGAMIIIVGVYLVPMPAYIANSIFKQSIIQTLDEIVFSAAIPRAVVINPLGGWNTLYSLFIPICILLLIVQLTREEKFALLPLVIILGLSSGFIGLLQAVGNQHSALYFYRITNNGSAVGFFANRNHQAILLALIFPMLSVYACAGVKTPEQATYRGWAAIFAGTVLIPLIFVTGSRTGLLISTLALVMAYFIYRKPSPVISKKRKAKNFNWRVVISGFAVILLGLLTALTSRAEALRRLINPDDAGDARADFWRPVVRMANSYFPVGSGPGGFVEAYASVEPDRLLDTTYLNHAHNDWLELYSSFGLMGVLFALAVMIAMSIACRKLWLTRKENGRDVIFAQLGFMMLVIMVLASFGDYPLRTPIFGSLFVISAIWASGISKPNLQNL